MWQIKLYQRGKLIATFSYATQQAQMNAALAIRKWFYDDFDEWSFPHVELPGPKFTLAVI